MRSPRLRKVRFIYLFIFFTSDVMIDQSIVSPVRIPRRIVARQQPQYGMTFAAHLGKQCECSRRSSVVMMIVTALYSFHSGLLAENSLKLINQYCYDEHSEQGRLQYQDDAVQSAIINTISLSDILSKHATTKFCCHQDSDFFCTCR